MRDVKSLVKPSGHILTAIPDWLILSRDLENRELSFQIIIDIIKWQLNSLESESDSKEAESL